MVESSGLRVKISRVAARRLCEEMKLPAMN